MVFYFYFTMIVLYTYYVYVMLYHRCCPLTNWPILFKFLTLNINICNVLLHLSEFWVCLSLSSVIDFSNTGARAPISAECAHFFYCAKGNAVWTSFDGSVKQYPNGWFCWPGCLSSGVDPIVSSHIWSCRHLY